MLRKLMKYEFKATARMLLPLYGVLLVLSFICKLFIGTNLEGTNMKVLGGIPAMMSMAAYGITMTATIVVTLIIIIQRFYKNLLCDEGYLMNTLPVKVWKNITSKLIIAILWTIVSMVIAGISIFIMAYKPGAINVIIDGLSQIFRDGYNQIGVSVYIIPIEVIILGLIQTILGTITIYTAIAIGQLVNRRKILCSFGAFIVINMITNAVVGIITPIFLIAMEGASIASINGWLLLVCIISIALAAGLFVACNYILKNKLNLE